MKKVELIKQLSRIRLKTGKQGIDTDLFINSIIISLASSDTNILIMTRDMSKGTTDQGIDLVDLMDAYFKNIMTIMNEDELKRLKERMN